MGDVIVAFDDFIHGNTTAYSSSFFNALLGELETYAIQAIVESVAGSADTQFELQLETSGDGRNWSNKNLVPEVNIAVTGGTTASGVGTDTNLHAGCALVRLRITLSAGVGTPAAKVIVYVRETTSRAFEPRVLDGCVF